MPPVMPPVVTPVATPVMTPVNLTARGRAILPELAAGGGK